MTITRALLGSLVTTSNLQAYGTGDTGGSGAVAGSANQRIVAYVVTSDTVTPSTHAVANDPWGIANANWIVHGSVLHPDGLSRLTVISGLTGGSAPGSDTFDITADQGTGNQTGCLIYVSGYTDSSGQPPTIEQVVFDSAGSAADFLVDTMATLGSASWVEAAGTNNDGTPVATPLESWVEAFEDGYTQPAQGLVVIHSNGVTSDNTPSYDYSSASTWAGAAVEIAEPASGITQAVGTATETDAAQALGKIKTRAAGTSTETDTAQPIGRLTTVAVGTALETDSAEAIGRRKSLLVGIASESDLSQTIGSAKTKAVDSALETNSAEAIGRAKSLLVGTSTETDTAQAIGRAKSLALPVALETDTAEAILSGGITQAVTMATESDAAQALGRIKTRAVGSALESDTAQALGRIKTRAVGIALESDAAIALGRAKVKALAAALESDAAQALGRVKLRALVSALETDAAQGFGRAKTRLVGIAAETDSALQITHGFSIVVTAALETDTAVALGRRKSLLVGIALETDTAIAITAQGPVAGVRGTGRALDRHGEDGSAMSRPVQQGYAGAGRAGEGRSA